MEHHMVNMDMDRFLELRAHAVGSDDLAELPPRTPPSGDPRERFRTFVEVDTLSGPTTLASLLHHLSTAWERRKAPNVALFHYADYQVDLPGELVRLAAVLGMEFAEGRIVVLAAEASLERMRARADEIVPSASLGIWRNTTAFLRAGASGQWQERVTEDDIARYEQRVASLVPPDLAAWAHLGRIGSGVEPT
jgi:Sulfotransferase domain